MSHFRSSLLHTSFFTDQVFLIPAYQRPYVWGDQQIKKMLQDFWETFDRDPNDTYYLGTVVTAQSGPKEEELIDGQQRFTTLWLIALAFERLGISSDLSRFLKADRKIRLRFEIRAEVQEYLQSLSDNPGRSHVFDLPAEAVKEKPFLSGIAHAGEIILQLLPQYFKDKEDPSGALKEFADYIATRVVFVKNTAPAGTDLQKLFTTLNNSGIQLEQTDILKSRLLEKIQSDKHLYSKIWESCENMDNYFEHNVKEAFQPVGDLRPQDFSTYQQEWFPLISQADGLSVNTRKMSLADILAMSDEENDSLKVKTSDGREITCESIITFPQLLLHTLRVFLQKEELNDLALPFHSNKLLESFEILTSPENLKPDEDQIKRFFLILWKVRYLFDKYVVKWVESNGERILGIRPVTSKLVRGTVAKQTTTVMLQSMLYFTGNYNTQLWLSPYLKDLLEGKTTTADLEQIDDYLSLSLNTEKQATWDLMSGNLKSAKFDYRTYLDGQLGTGFRHYWFYKLEYVLWKTWQNRDIDRFRNYRITSKNSVEHICSRNDEYGAKLQNAEGRQLKDTFGNLTLLSVGQNSGYSNQDTGKKKIDHDKKAVYDSLKLSRFFDTCQYGVSPENVVLHQMQMLELLDGHYSQLLESVENDELPVLADEEDAED